MSEEPEAPDPLTEDDLRHYQASLRAARRANRVRREVEDRIADRIEELMYNATQKETIEALLSLARDILDPVKTR